MVLYFCHWTVTFVDNFCETIKRIGKYKSYKNTGKFDHIILKFFEWQNGINKRDNIRKHLKSIIGKGFVSWIDQKPVTNKGKESELETSKGYEQPINNEIKS